ncbi:MAG: hypothetical protein U1E35_06150 [Rhodospirillales bacterium]
MLPAPLVRIRPGRPGDADAIARVYVESWRSAYAGLIPNGVLVRMSTSAQAREWGQQLSRRNMADAVLVADLPGAGIIGFGSCGIACRSRCRRRARSSLFTSPRNIRNGDRPRLCSGCSTG